MAGCSTCLGAVARALVAACSRIYIRERTFRSTCLRPPLAVASGGPTNPGRPHQRCRATTNPGTPPTVRHPWIRRRRRRAPPRTKATRSGRAPPRSRAPARATQNLFIVKFPKLSPIVYTQQPTDSPAESEKKPTTDPAGSAFSLTLFPKIILITYEPHVPGSTPAREPDSGH